MWFNCTVLIQARMLMMSSEMREEIGVIAEEVQRTTGKVPHFKIDVNIDQIQLFENTTAGSAIPILGRIHSIGKFKIPIRRSLPFLIGMYHGPGNWCIWQSMTFCRTTDGSRLMTVWGGRMLFPYNSFVYSHFIQGWRTQRNSTFITRSFLTSCASYVSCPRIT